MDINIPRIRIIRPQHATLVTERIVMQMMMMAFWSSFITVPVTMWVVWKSIRPFFGQI